MTTSNKEKAKALYTEMNTVDFIFYSAAQKRGFCTRAKNLAGKIDLESGDMDEQQATMYLDCVSLRTSGDIWR